MSNYSTVKIEEGFYSIEQDYVRCFLFEGEKEALLVDTGIGGELRKYVEGTTKLPITLISTHSDPDHVGASAQFDKRLMHPCEFSYYQNLNSNWVPMEPVWEGDIIDLGKFCFEIILIPGHTPGSIALLERKKRFLIGGDSIQTGRIFMMGNGRNFHAFCASMKKLQGMLGEFDTVYSSHSELAVNSGLVNQLYSGSRKVIDKEVEGKPEKVYDRSFNCIEIDGVSFYAD